MQGEGFPTQGSNGPTQSGVLQFSATLTLSTRDGTGSAGEGAQSYDTVPTSEAKCKPRLLPVVLLTDRLQTGSSHDPLLGFN